MKYELIAVDLDGTLLNNQSEISSRNAQALHRVEQLGAKAVSYTHLDVYKRQAMRLVKCMA